MIYSVKRMLSEMSKSALSDVTQRPEAPSSSLQVQIYDTFLNLNICESSVVCLQFVVCLRDFFFSISINKFASL